MSKLPECMSHVPWNGIPYPLLLLMDVSKMCAVWAAGLTRGMRVERWCRPEPAAYHEGGQGAVLAPVPMLIALTTFLCDRQFSILLSNVRKSKPSLAKPCCTHRS